MATTYVDYPLSGAGQTKSIPFPYIDTPHIYVKVGGAEVSTGLFSVSGSSVTFLSGFPSGTARVGRRTPISALVGAQNGTASLDWEGMNANFLVSRYILEEYQDSEAERNGVVSTLGSQVSTITSSVSSAVSTSSAAALNAGTALSTANAAKAESDLALSTANAAKAESALALSTANAASSTASTALSNSSVALDTASSADAKASSALSGSAAAVSASGDAVATATSALEIAAGIGATAENAFAVAQEAKDIAETAVGLTNLHSSAIVNDSAFPGGTINDALASVNSASSSAIASLSSTISAFSTSLSNYRLVADSYTKTEVDTYNAQNAKLSGATFTGAVSATSITSSSGSVTSKSPSASANASSYLRRSDGTMAGSLVWNYAANRVYLTAYGVDGATTGTQIGLNCAAGGLTLPAETSIGNVSSTELSYLDGVTSPIQAQLTSKASAAHTHTSSSISDFTAAAIAAQASVTPLGVGSLALAVLNSVGGAIVAGNTYTGVRQVNLVVNSTVVENNGMGTSNLGGTWMALTNVAAATGRYPVGLFVRIA